MQEKLAITVLVIMLALFALVLVLYNLVKSKGESYNQIVLSHQDSREPHDSLQARQYYRPERDVSGD
ncbi:MAG: hypothetical protein ACLTR6_10580 [Clostridium fessum]